VTIRKPLDLPPDVARAFVEDMRIDVLVRADAIFGWKADTIPPGAIGHPDCADHIGKIVMRLRRSYDLG
jgi:hypothetical protein